MKHGKVQKPVILLWGVLAVLLAASAKAQQAATPIARPPATPAPAPGVTPTKAAAVPAKDDSVPPDKVVLKAGEGSATAADLDYFISTIPQETMPSLQGKGQGRRPVGDEYAGRLALAEQALRDHLDQDPGFVRRMAFARLDGLAKAEYDKLEGEMTASPDEISKYYSAHLSDFQTMDIRRIMIHSRPPGSKPGAPGLDPDEGKARLEAIRKELLAGKDPAEIAKELKDTRQGFLDAKPQTLRATEFLGQIPDQWRAAVSKLKDGEITEVLAAGRLGYVSIQLVKRGQGDLQSATPEVAQQVRYEKLRAQVEGLKNKAGIWMDDAYFKLPIPVPQAQNKPPAASAPAARGAQH